MKVKFIFSSALLLLLFIFISSCKEASRVDKGQSQISDDTTLLTSLTNRWNESIVKQDYMALTELYAKQISIYGLSISNQQAVSNKKDFFEANPNFNQSITGNISISKIRDNSYELLFPKRTNFGGTTSNVKGYLIFEKISGTYKIVSESDETTDKNLSKQNIIKIGDKKLKCSEIVLQILKSSQRYKERTNGYIQRIKDNGGKGFEVYLWASPNPRIDGSDSYSEDYQYSIHEIYSDRQPRIVDFKFSPKSQQLYEEDGVQAWEFEPIEFDRRLLPKFNKTCN